MIEIVNRQRRRRIEAEHWRDFAVRALRAAGRDGESANIVFISDRAMRDLNQRFRGRKGTTDVLSFPADHAPFEQPEDVSLGEVVISVEQAGKQATENGLRFEDEIAQLILHGLLHLCGYDHEKDEGEMNRLELRLRRQLGI
jgi:probable rRNA maturation factor